MGTRVRGWLPIGCRLAVGVLFLISGAYKMVDPLQFQISLAELGLTGQFHRAAVLAVPPVEIACGLFLAANILPRLTASVVLTLLIAFTSVLASATLRGGTVTDCGCFPVREPSSILYYLMRNGLLAVAALVVIVSPRSRPVSPEAGTGSPAVEDPPITEQSSQKAGPV